MMRSKRRIRDFPVHRSWIRRRWTKPLISNWWIRETWQRVHKSVTPSPQSFSLSPRKPKRVLILNSTKPKNGIDPFQQGLWIITNMIRNIVLLFPAFSWQENAIEKKKKNKRWRWRIALHRITIDRTIKTLLAETAEGDCILGDRLCGIVIFALFLLFNPQSKHEIFFLNGINEEENKKDKDSENHKAEP